MSIPTKPGFMIMAPIPVLRGPLQRPRSTVQVWVCSAGEDPAGSRSCDQGPNDLSPATILTQSPHTGTQERNGTVSSYQCQRCSLRREGRTASGRYLCSPTSRRWMTATICHGTPVAFSTCFVDGLVSLDFPSDSI